MLKGLTLLLVCVGVVGVFAATASAATATTYTVNTTTDDPPSSGVDGTAANCASGSTTPCSLRDAITAANANTDSDPATTADNDVINVPAGTYVISNGINLPIITHNVQILGAAANTTTVNGNDGNTNNGPVSHVFEIGLAAPLPVPASSHLSTPTAPTVQISGLTVTGGFDYFDLDQGGGGGIVLDYVEGTGPTLNLYDSTVTGNGAIGAWEGGGGILVNQNATLNAWRDSIVDNAALGGAGIFDNGPPFLSAGAGVFDGGTASITDSTVAENSTNCSPGYFVCTESPIAGVLAGNGSGGPGGGIFVSLQDINAPITLLNDTIANNVGNAQGGGISAEAFYSCSIIIINNCSGSRSSHWKAAQAAARAGVAGAQVFQADPRGGGPAISPLSIQNTILARNSVLATFNSPAQSSYQDCFVDVGIVAFGAPGIDDLGNNLDYDQTNSCGFNSASKNDFVSVDPGLPTQLKLNGGTTPNYAPALGSLPVDAGNNSACAEGVGMSGPFDQRGLARISGPSCDMGAVEAQYPPPPAVVTTAPSVTPTAPSTRVLGIRFSGVSKQCSRSKRLTVTSSALAAGARPTIRVYLDGRRIRLVHGVRVRTVVNISHLRRGRHTLRVTVTANGRTTSRVIRFSACRAAVTPRFTG